MSVTDTGRREFVQVNLTLPEDLAKRFLSLVARIAELKGLPLPMKSNKRWEDVADAVSCLCDLGEAAPESLWRKI